MNLFLLPISLHQGDLGGTLAWENIPGSYRWFYCLPVVPIKGGGENQNDEDRKGTTGSQFCHSRPRFTQIHPKMKSNTCSKDWDCVEPRSLPSTCTPFSEAQSSQVRWSGVSLILLPNPRCNLFPSWKLPSSDVAITSPHLPPPRALLTLLICFPLLK